MSSSIRSLAVLLLLASCAPGAGRNEFALTVTISAGDHDRRGTPVSFALPRPLSGDALALVGEAGDVLPVQLSGGQEATVILDHLPAGATRQYRLQRHRPAEGRVSAERRNGAVEISVAGQPLLRYNHAETDLPTPDIDPVFRRGGYIHPVVTPSGRVVTGDYPSDHIHHHGIWTAWTNTEFEGRRPDFWNMGQRRGTVLPVALDSVWSGPVHSGFSARHRYMDLTAEAPREALTERWTLRAYPLESGPYRVFDLEIVHNAASGSPLRLPEYHYGGLGFRGRDEWTGEDNTFFLTSEGRDRSDGHATRARWAHIGGYVDGELVGIGILTHPDNFRFPEPMRIHPSEPFFNWAPSQLGDWSIEPGRPFVARYRFVVADGGPDSEVLERLWQDLATPPEVTVTDG